MLKVNDVAQQELRPGKFLHMRSGARACAPSDTTGYAGSWRPFSPPFSSFVLIGLRILGIRNWASDPGDDMWASGS